MVDPIFSFINRELFPSINGLSPHYTQNGHPPFNKHEFFLRGGVPLRFHVKSFSEEAMGRLPTRHDLDAAVGDLPAAFFRRCHHACVLSSAALRRAAQEGGAGGGSWSAGLRVKFLGDPTFGWDHKGKPTARDGGAAILRHSQSWPLYGCVCVLELVACFSVGLI